LMFSFRFGGDKDCDMALGIYMVETEFPEMERVTESGDAIRVCVSEARDTAEDEFSIA